MESHVVDNVRQKVITKSLRMFFQPLEGAGNEQYSGVGSNPSTPTKRQKGRKTTKAKQRHKVC